MFIQKHTYFIIIFIIFFSGCTLNNFNQNKVLTPIKQEQNIKEPIKIKKTLAKKKRVQTYKFCQKHTKVMTHASRYIKEEFQKGYFIQKDIIGAKAQLFLIESNSKSIFSQNINNAIKSYNTQHNLAKKNKCNLKKFKRHPIESVKRKIKMLEIQMEKSKEIKK